MPNDYRPPSKNPTPLQYFVQPILVTQNAWVILDIQELSQNATYCDLLAI